MKKILTGAVSWCACAFFIVAPGTVIATCGVPGTAVLVLTLYSGILPYTLNKII
jgi:hypothetical protein